MLKNYNHLIHLTCPPEAYIDEAILKQVSQLVLIPGSDPPSQMFRRTVRHQQVALRRRLQIYDRDFCLDHHPVPFSSIRRIFLKQHGINPDNLPRESLTADLFKDWQQFHGKMAEYRVLDPQVHRLMGIGYSAYFDNSDSRLYLLGYIAEKVNEVKQVIGYE